MRVSPAVAGATTLFCGVEVEPPPPPPRGASRASIDKFVCQFDAEMLVMDCCYTNAELVAAIQQHLGGGISSREVASALRRVSPAALAGPGRRAAALVPTPAEIDAAARRAAETLP